MTEIQQRIVDAARSWIGTPYHHQGNVKGLAGGVDCAMLLVRIYCDLGVVPLFDPRPYPENFYLHSDEERYMTWVRKYGIEVETPEPADIAVFKFGKVICHGGVMVAADRMVHAYQQAFRVEESELAGSPLLRKHFKGYWRMATWPSG